MSIKGFFFLFFSSLLFTLEARNKPSFTVIFNPAGDAQYIGRIIDETFERGITLQFVEYLQKILEQRIPSARFLITRSPGEISEPLHNGSFANRMKGNLFVSMHFYEKKDQTPQCDIYYFCKNKLTDSWQLPPEELNFLPYNCAHLKNFKLTKLLAEKSTLFIKEKYSSLFLVQEPLGIPFSPLLGIQSPSLAFEISLRDKNEWKRLVIPFADLVEHIITSIKKEAINA